jgi:hypothetical protein
MVIKQLNKINRIFDVINRKKYTVEMKANEENIRMTAHVTYQQTYFIPSSRSFTSMMTVQIIH